jgi:hypothetical protein
MTSLPARQTPQPPTVEYFALFTLIVWESWKLYQIMIEGLSATNTIHAFILSTIADPLVWLLVIGILVLQQRRGKTGS